MEKIYCKWCGVETYTLNEECDGCWELRHRIEHNMELAKKMMAHLNQTTNKAE